ncbi:MAG: hypothetical protein R3F37_02185 [Candidatus Competibacteraceae bacterium]
MIIPYDPSLATKSRDLEHRLRAGFMGIWIEKGMGLVVPGFIPTPLGEIFEYPDHQRAPDCCHRLLECGNTDIHSAGQGGYFNRNRALAPECRTMNLSGILVMVPPAQLAAGIATSLLPGGKLHTEAQPDGSQW